MKKAQTHPLILLVSVFTALLIGFFIGRNVNRTPVHIRSVPAAVEAGSPAATDSASFREPAPSVPLLININTATLDELQTLPGIGPVYAQRIIDYRREHGPYSSPGDLLNVEGIGTKRLEDIWDYITTGG